MSCSCFGSTAVRRNHGGGGDRNGVDGDLLRDVNHIAYEKLRSATEDFDPRKKIGRGGFGTVYKGTLKSGKQIAVKTLSVHSKQGVREFLNEIRAMSKAKHPNLVELVGCCVQGANRILVYEFVENNSLEHCLLGSRNPNVKLDWGQRAAICLGIARGLAYLHEELVPHIVHRDIKASNILLDGELNPKIGDFGLAKLFPDDITHISTRIAGTTYGRLLDLVDPEMGEFPDEHAVRHMKVAFFCTQATANKRPTMTQVVEMLSSTNIRLNDKVLTPPGFFPDSDGVNNKKSTAESSGNHSSVPVTITEVAPR
ncbi:Cold-responsive protein kinase 1 [Linum perenne]